MRHRRVWVSASTLATDIHGADAASIAQLLEWARRGLPLVGRAKCADDLPFCVPLGLAVPPRRRLAFGVPAQWVEQVQPPLPLSDALGGLMGSMRDTAEHLAHAARQLSMPLFAYGSVFWQHVSGDACLHERSDLDLLAQPCSSDQARAWLDVLARADRICAVRIDGEIESPSGAATAWRELASGSDRVLVKSDAGPALWPRDRLWAEWAERAEWSQAPVSSC